MPHWESCHAALEVLCGVGLAAERSHVDSFGAIRGIAYPQVYRSMIEFELARYAT